MELKRIILGALIGALTLGATAAQAQHSRNANSTPGTLHDGSLRLPGNFGRMAEGSRAPRPATLMTSTL